MGKTPFPPITIRPLPDKFGNGMDRGTRKRTGNTVAHSMLGTLDGSDAYFRRSDVAASTDYGIGGSLDGIKNGTIYQWVDVHSNRIPWASGPWHYPGYGDGLKYFQTYGIYGINAYAESIEMSGQQSTVVTTEQWQKFVWLVAAINHDAGRSADEFFWSMHHREFCTPSYKDCPWPRVYNYTNEYLKAISDLMLSYEGKTISDHAMIAGKAIPLPIGQGTQPDVPAPNHPIFVAFDTKKTAETYNASLRQYGNTTALIYDHVVAGTVITLVGYYIGQMVNGSDKWYVLDSHLHERIHESGIRKWL
jgi:hypothetical protein